LLGLAQRVLILAAQKCHFVRLSYWEEKGKLCMSKDTNSASKVAGAARLLSVEQVFRALPPFGSPEYIEHITKATATELPPEVLARALRQLPPTSDGFAATLERLMRRKGKGWEYFGPLMAKARRRKVVGHDHEDVMHDALLRIIKILPTQRGEFAEHAWHSFCLREASDAWRERFGRRDERIPKEEPVSSGQSVELEEAGESPEAVFDTEDLPPWHIQLRDDNSERIELMAQEVIEKLPDEFVRNVAKRVWFADQRPKVSGTKSGKATLTDEFPGKTRHQIQRALRQAKSQLAATLLADAKVDWSKEIEALLKTERDGAPKKSVRKEKKQ